jgi:hypothetical protein
MHDFSPAASQSNTFSITVYSIRTSPSFILLRGRAGRKEVESETFVMKKAGRAFPLVAAAALSCLLLQFLSSLPADSLYAGSA